MTTSTVRRWLALPRLAAVAGRALLACALAWAAPAALAAPASGSIIGNQAAATYTDASGTSQSATSNLVQTVVQQVGGLALTGTIARSAAPGGTAYFAHTLTNSGNGSDTFSLALSHGAGTGGLALTDGSVAIYLDADGNGLPDTTTPLASGTTSFTTPAIAAGGTYRFVVALTAPGTATVGQTDNVTVTATAGTPALYTTTTATNTATVTVATTTPVFAVTKSISLSQGGASAASCAGTDFSGGTCVRVTYTLSYTNAGTAAGPLYLRDVIGTGTTAGMQYVTGSARWNTGNVLTDVASGDPTGIDFQAITATGTTTVQAVVASVAPGASGTVSFQVGILSTASVGTGTTNNSAEFATATNTTVATGTPGATQPTNASAYSVSARYSVVANNNTTSSTDHGDDNVAAGVNVVTVSTAVAGSSITFTPNVIWNTGNSTDTFNIVLADAGAGFGFPTGTVYSAFRADGTTPLTDSNGDGVVDTGPVAAGANVTIVVRAAVPANACASVTCGASAANMTVHVTARSVGDPSVSNKVYDRLASGGLTAPSVTLGSGTSSPGTLWNGGTNPAIVTTAVNAGASVSFDLVVRNAAANGSPADSYDLQASATNFASGSVPVPGWTVTFRVGLCSANGTVITNTGSIAAQGSVNVCAVVTTVAASTAATYDVYLRAVSPNSAASATMRNAVTINTSTGLTLTPAGTGQLAAGGSIVYAHLFANTGTVSCPAPTFTVSQSLAAQGWTAVVYDDVNGNGELDSGDTTVTSPLSALGVGNSRRLLVRVFAPGGAAVGATDVLTFTVTDATCGTASLTDRTSVMSGQLRLVKTQALDAACDGTADGALSVSQVSARPNQCVVYTVVATNLGATAVTLVSITDATPPFTTLRSGSTPTCSAGTMASPGGGNAGTVACNGIASIAAGASVTLVFHVRIDP